MADIKKSFEDIANWIREGNPNNMNAALDPEFVSHDDQEMTSVTRYKVQEWELNQRNQVHGGAVTAMFDTAMGSTVAAYSGRNVTTAEMSTSFVRPFFGEEFDFVSKVINIGRSLSRVECKAYNVESGKLVATAHATFAYIDWR
ncbi:MAG: PaaI family thioesterase [Eubacterium sp.]|nr:PaaI family thioesterase [Candidatus Colimonas fimequi]